MSSINLFIADDHTSTGFREATLDEIMNGARQALSARVRRGTLLNSPRLTANFLIARLGQRPHETFTLIYLDNRHRMIACEDLFRGTIDGASVHPREVIKEALRHNSAAVIFAHNHPLCFVWGVTTPVIGHCVRMECANPSSEKEGDGESCPVASDHITPVSPSRRLRCSRARARSSTRRVAVRPACDGCAAA